MIGDESYDSYILQQSLYVNEQKHRMKCSKIKINLSEDMILLVLSFMDNRKCPISNKYEKSFKQSRFLLHNVLQGILLYYRNAIVL